MPILDPDKPYTFRSFFDLRIDTIDLAQYFGYQFRRQTITFPLYPHPIDRLDFLKQDILDTLPRLVRLNEQVKREALIFPVINTAARYADFLMRIEYPIKVTEQLQGTIDYLLSVGNLEHIVVIEAKQGDLDYGFTQLAAELIALDQWDRSPPVDQQPEIVGAVTIGDLWRFGKLERHSKVVVGDINSYRVPEDLEPLLRILIEI